MRLLLSVDQVKVNASLHYSPLPCDHPLRSHIPFFHAGTNDAMRMTQHFTLLFLLSLCVQDLASAELLPQPLSSPRYLLAAASNVDLTRAYFVGGFMYARMADLDILHQVSLLCPLAPPRSPHPPST